MLLAKTTHSRLSILSCFLIGILLSVVHAAPQHFTAKCDATAYSLDYQEEFDGFSLQPTFPVTEAAAEFEFSAAEFDGSVPDDMSLEMLLSEEQVATPPPYTTYHSASSADHQFAFNVLSAAGYRLISLSVYGNLANQRYAAVWVKPAVAPTWSAIHGATGAQYQTFFNRCAAAGLHPILLTAAGDGAQTVFAGTCEARPGPIPLTRFGLTSGAVTDSHTIEYWNRYAHTRGLILTSGAIYGTAAAPLFAGIWPRNTSPLKWFAGVRDSSVQYQARFDTAVLAGFRPSFVTLSSYDQYLSVFVNNTIGPWIARHGLTATQYVAELGVRQAGGFYPFVLQAGGIGAAAHFAVLFAQNPV
jgi:hypothetical protein